MGIFRSPNIVLDGLVFGYDADDRSPRFYPGEPTVNEATSSYGTGMMFWINSGGADATNDDITISKPTVSINNPNITIYSAVVTSTGNIQVGSPLISVTPGASYSVSIYAYFATSTMQTNPYVRTYTTNVGIANFAYNGSTTFSDWPKNQWIRLTAHVTIPAEDNMIYLSSYIGDAVGDKVYYSTYQVEQKSHVTQFVYGTRSSTQSLIDLKRTTSIDVSNINFDSTAHPVFDGTDDFLKIGNEQLIHRTSNFSYNIWMNQTSTDGTDTLFENGFWSSSFLIRLEGGTSIAIYSMSAYWGAFSFTPLMNVWYYLSFVREGSTLYFYVNGVYQSSMGFTADIQPNTNYLYVGASQHSTPQGFIGKLPTVHIYNKALSAPDVMQNFLALRERFIKIGESPLYPAISALEIKQRNPSALDGVYWIDLPTVGPTRTYCLLDSKYNGGGWMMVMKATRGTTFQYDANYWTTNNTLNPTDLTRNDADAKYDVMNYYNSKDIMALWPDITTDGGSISGLGVWSWLENNFNGGNRVAPITFFNTVDRYFIKDAKTFSGWASGIFSSQTDVRFYGFNFHNNGNWSKTRWGFGWNENGGGLYPNGDMNSDDVSGGIGLMPGFGNYSAGEQINCCQDTTGINRSARVELYVR